MKPIDKPIKKSSPQNLRNIIATIGTPYVDLHRCTHFIYLDTTSSKCVQLDRSSEIFVSVRSSQRHWASVAAATPGARRNAAAMEMEIEGVREGGTDSDDGRGDVMSKRSREEWSVEHSISCRIWFSSTCFLFTQTGNQIKATKQQSDSIYWSPLLVMQPTPLHTIVTESRRIRLMRRMGFVGGGWVTTEACISRNVDRRCRRRAGGVGWGGVEFMGVEACVFRCIGWWDWAVEALDGDWVGSETMVEELSVSQNWSGWIVMMGEEGVEFEVEYVKGRKVSAIVITDTALWWHGGSMSAGIDVVVVVSIIVNRRCPSAK